MSLLVVGPPPLRCRYWATLFSRPNDTSVYIIGTSDDGNAGVPTSIVLSQSKDEGVTWSPCVVLSPSSNTKAYSTGPTPVGLWGGRLWRAFEHNVGPGWGSGCVHCTALHCAVSSARAGLHDDAPTTTRPCSHPSLHTTTAQCTLGRLRTATWGRCCCSLKAVVEPPALRMPTPPHPNPQPPPLTPTPPHSHWTASPLLFAAPPPPPPPQLLSAPAVSRCGSPRPSGPWCVDPLWGAALLCRGGLGATCLEQQHR